MPNKKVVKRKTTKRWGEAYQKAQLARSAERKIYADKVLDIIIQYHDAKLVKYASGRDFAMKTGISTECYYRYMHRHSMPSLPNMLKLVDELDIPEELWRESFEKAQSPQWKVRKGSNPAQTGE